VRSDGPKAENRAIRVNQYAVPGRRRMDCIADWEAVNERARMSQSGSRRVASDLILSLTSDLARRRSPWLAVAFLQRRVGEGG